MTTDRKPTAALADQIPTERVDEIVAHLNSFIGHEYEGGTDLAARIRTIIGVVETNLGKSVEWALAQPEVAITCGPDPRHGGADVELTDGTVLVWSPDLHRWAIAAGTDLDTGRAVPVAVPAQPAASPASDYVISRSDSGAVRIRAKSPDRSAPLGGELLGFTRPITGGWVAIWRNLGGHSHTETETAADSITAEALLFDRLNIAPAAGIDDMSLPTWDELSVSWVAGDGGEDLVTVVDQRTGKPVLELPPCDALAVAAQLIGHARDAVMAGGA